MNSSTIRPALTDAYILAGGRSKRFGTDKARAVLRGEMLIARVARLLHDAGIPSVTAVAGVPDAYSDLNLRTVADLHPGCGPLAGLERALTDAWERGVQWTLLVSCDLVVLRPGWVDTLLKHRRAESKAVCFRNDHWQPFPGLYNVDLLPAVRECLASETASFRALLDCPESAAVAANRPTDWPEFVSVNTPAELRWHSFLQKCAERNRLAELTRSPSEPERVPPC